MAEGSVLTRRAREETLAGWVTVACIAYAVAFAALRLATVRAILYDDTLEELRGQGGLALAYFSTQPPLYTWILRAAALGLGSAPLAHTLVKYTCFAIAGIAIFHAARATIADVRLAAFATGSLLVVWDLGVEAHRQLTQTILLLAFIAATWLVVARILDHGMSVARAVALGLVAAGGALTKYSYAIYALSLAVVVALDAPSRRRFADRRLWLSLAIVAVLVAPHLVAMQGLGRVSVALYDGDPGGLVERRLRMALNFAWVVAEASIPLPLVWAAFFPAAFRRVPAGAPPPGLHEKLLARWCCVALGAFALGPVLLGTFTRAHYLQPILVPGAILFFARLARLSPSSVALRRFAWVLLATVIAGAVAVFAWLGIEAYNCRRCPPLRDYGPAAQALARAGAGDALIIGDDFQTVGNLLALLPRARGWALVVDPPDAIPADARGRACALVWDSAVGAAAAAPVPTWVQPLVRTPPGIAEVRNVASPIRRLLGGAPRLYWLSFAVVPPDACVLPR